MDLTNGVSRSSRTGKPIAQLVLSPSEGLLLQYRKLAAQASSCSAERLSSIEELGECELWFTADNPSQQLPWMWEGLGAPHHLAASVVAR